MDSLGLRITLDKRKNIFSWGIFCLLAVATVVVGFGCHRPHYQEPWLGSEAAAIKALDQAVACPAPDERRERVEWVGGSDYVQRPAIVERMSRLAMEDASLAVRQAAVRALGRSQSAAVVDLLLNLVGGAQATTVSGPRPPGPPVEPVIVADAFGSLKLLIEADQLSQEQRARLIETVITALDRNPHREVRLAAAELMGLLPDQRVVAALIEALEQRDFAVPFEAKRSLVALTGQDFGFDAQVWRQWLAKTSGPLDGGDEDS